MELTSQSDMQDRAGIMVPTERQASRLQQQRGKSTDAMDAMFCQLHLKQVGDLEEKSHTILQRLTDAAITAIGGQHVLTRQGMLCQWRRRLEAAMHFAAADAVLNALSQSDTGRQVATRWGSITPVPPALQAYADHQPGGAGADAGTPEAQTAMVDGGTLASTGLQICSLAPREEAQDLLAAGVADFIAAEEEAGLLPAGDLLTADEEAAWHLHAPGC